MLYATMDKKRWESLPAEWDEVQDMFKYLQRMTYGTQLTFESRMFNTEGSYPYRCSLIRWARTSTEKQREILLETTDPDQMKAALIMLISEAEEQTRAHKTQWVRHEI
jgi:hypothetical protein